MNAPTILRAEPADADTILAIQKLAFESEARACGEWEIPPLQESVDEVLAHIRTVVVLKAVEAGQVIGSIRGVPMDGACYITRLGIAPHAQGRGLGGALLAAIEQAHPQARAFELLANQCMPENVRFYQRHGYAIVETRRLSDSIALEFMRKVAGA
jgi:ribosomal protein S18 acetylase RimI-like enzyme